MVLSAVSSWFFYSFLCWPQRSEVRFKTLGFHRVIHSKLAQRWRYYSVFVQEAECSCEGNRALLFWSGWASLCEVWLTENLITIVSLFLFSGNSLFVLPSMAGLWLVPAGGPMGSLLGIHILALILVDWYFKGKVATWSSQKSEKPWGAGEAGSCWRGLGCLLWPEIVDGWQGYAQHTVLLCAYRSWSRER